MKALIVDDEKKARDVLELLIRHHISEIDEIKLAESGSHATQVLGTFNPDLVFLDIKMPDQDGFTWLKSLTNRTFDVIFTTAYDQYAITAIRFSAFDYLLKPVDIEDLKSTVTRYRTHQDQREASFETLFYNAQQQTPEDYRLTIATTEGSYFLRPSEIVRCEADGNYTHFYLENGSRILASRSLGHFAGLLSGQEFVRCHKSHLVNRKFIDALSDKQLLLTTGVKIDVSRRRMPRVKEAMTSRDSPN